MGSSAVHKLDRNVLWVVFVSVPYLIKALPKQKMIILATTGPTQKEKKKWKTLKKIPQIIPTCNSRQFAQRKSLPSCCTQTHFLNIWIWICAWVKIILIVIMKTMIMMAVMMKMTLTLFSADHKLGGDCWLVLQTRGSLGLGRWPFVVLLSILKLL